MRQIDSVINSNEKFEKLKLLAVYHNVEKVNNYMILSNWLRINYLNFLNRNFFCHGDHFSPTLL